MQQRYEKSKTCCFTGHRFIPDYQCPELNKALQNVITELIGKGVSTFISGGALGFDTLAAQCVLEIKKYHPRIKLVMLLPCRGQHAKWKISDRNVYEKILMVADDIIFLNDKYITGCMHQRNREMVRQSGYCIAYFDGKPGGTAYTVGIAGEQGLSVVNIYPNI